MRSIEKLDYHPNPSARGLGGNRSYLLALLYDVSCDYYATSVLSGVIETCRAAKYQVVMRPCDYQSATVVDGRSKVVSGATVVSGCVVATATTGSGRDASRPFRQA